MPAIKWLSPSIELNLNLKTNAYAFFQGEKVHKVIIAMHGFGDTGENFSALVSQLDVPGILWIFLDALFPIPQFFEDGRQWFPIFSEPYSEFEQSQLYVDSVIDSISQNLRLENKNIGLLGFSQGASLALQVTLRRASSLWLAISLSGFLLNTRALYENKDALNSHTPVFLAHGQNDNVVFPLSFFEAKNFLNFIGCTFESHIYPIEHSLSPEEFRDIKDFLKNKMHL